MSNGDRRPEEPTHRVEGMRVIAKTLAVLHKMTRESFSDMLTFKQRPEGSQEMNWTYI